MEKIKCYLFEDHDAEMKLDPEDPIRGKLSTAELVWCPICEFYLLRPDIKSYYFEKGLLEKEDKGKLSLRVQKDYDPNKPKVPVEITREMIKEETGKESVGYR